MRLAPLQAVAQITGRKEQEKLKPEQEITGPGAGRPVGVPQSLKSSHPPRCGVVWCGVVCCAVQCCAVLWCTLWCGVVWCGVVWCGVVWCAEGAVTRRQWPGCLPTGTGKRAGLCVSCARRVYVCRTRRREGEPRRPGRLALGDRPYSRSSRCTPSCSACWCRRSSCNAHAIVLPGPRRAFSSVARALAWAYQTRMDSSTTWRMNSVPSAWGPGCGVVWCGVVWCAEGAVTKGQKAGMSTHG